MSRFLRGCLITILVLFLMIVGVAVVAAIVGQGGLGAGIALIRIEGPIYESQDIVNAIRKARDSLRARAILVRVESPGGAVGASEEIYRELQKAREKKPVVVSMGNVAASGGYYLSTAANEIVANSGTITGSIGVIGTGFEVSQLLETLRIRPNVIKSAEHKDTGSPLRPMTEEERVLVQRLVFDLHRQFVREVARSRAKAIGKALSTNPSGYDEVLATSETKRMDKAIELAAFDPAALAREISVDVGIVEHVRQMADGRVFTGEQALKLGLVDSLGNMEDARARAASLAMLPKSAALIDYTPSKGFAALLTKAGEQAIANVASAVARREMVFY
jgi:protease-4